MADYIDRDKVLDAILDLPPKMDEQGYGWLGRMGVWQMIRDFQSADVAPVVHGNWGDSIAKYGILRHKCSVCNKYSHMPQLRSENGWCNMSILIKGMEMPKNCRKCRCSWSDFTRLYCEADGKPWGLEVTEYADGRHPDCPLIEIPDGHGDLIDRDWMLGNWFIYLNPRTMIEDAPTVIPADKDGET